MSVNIVLESNFDLQSLIEKSPQLGSGGITKVKVTRCALYTIGTLAAVASIPIAFTMPPAVVLSGSVAYYCFSKALYMHDYQNPRELNQMRIDAFSQNFQEIISSHGIQNVMAYNIASKDLIHQKFLQFCSVNSFYRVLNSDFKEALQKGLIPLTAARQGYFVNLQNRNFNEFNLEHVKQLLKMFVISNDDYTFFVSVDDLFKKYHKDYENSLQQLDSLYSKRTDRLLAELDEKVVVAIKDAEQLRVQILSKGYPVCSSKADVATCVDLILDQKSLGEIYVKNLDYKADGYLNSKEIAYRVSQEFLESKLAEIEAQRKYIKQNNIGSDEQLAYDLQINSQQQILNAQLKDLHNQVCDYCQSV